MITFTWHKHKASGPILTGSGWTIYHGGRMLAYVDHYRHGGDYTVHVIEGSFSKRGKFKSAARARKFAEQTIDDASICLFNDDDVEFIQAASN